MKECMTAKQFMNQSLVVLQKEHDELGGEINNIFFHNIMKQVKLFKENYYENLENEVNNFISESVQELEVIDVRYEVLLNKLGSEVWTAMVIYEQ